MAKGKNQSSLAHRNSTTITLTPVLPFNDTLPPQRSLSQRKTSKTKPELISSNPDRNPDVLDGPQALRASPDMEVLDEWLGTKHVETAVGEQSIQEKYTVALNDAKSDSPLSDLSSIGSPAPARKSKLKQNPKQTPKSLATKEGSVVEQEGTKSAASVAAKHHKESTKDPQFFDPEAENDDDAGEEEIQAAMSRPPPVNSNYLPLPWKGRLGYVS